MPPGPAGEVAIAGAWSVSTPCPRPARRRGRFPTARRRTPRPRPEPTPRTAPASPRRQRHSPPARLGGTPSLTALRGFPLPRTPTGNREPACCDAFTPGVFASSRSITLAGCAPRRSDGGGGILVRARRAPFDRPAFPSRPRVHPGGRAEARPYFVDSLISCITKNITFSKKFRQTPSRSAIATTQIRTSYLKITPGTSNRSQLRQIIPK